MLDQQEIFVVKVEEDEYFGDITCKVIRRRGGEEGTYWEVLIGNTGPTLSLLLDMCPYEMEIIERVKY